MRKSKFTLEQILTIPWHDSASAQSDSHLDEAVLATIRSRLSAERQIGFYLPQEISWEGQEIALAIGGTTYPKKNGSGESHCYGVIVSSETLQVRRVLSASELGSRNHAQCRVMP